MKRSWSHIQHCSSSLTPRLEWLELCIAHLILRLFRRNSLGWCCLLVLQNFWEHKEEIKRLKSDVYESYIWMVDDLENQLKCLTETKSSKGKSFKWDPYYLLKLWFVVKVYLFGKNGNSSNVTVSVSLVKGEYDSILAWLISHKKIKVSFLRQDKCFTFENNNHQITCNLRTGFPLVECFEEAYFADINNFESCNNFLGEKLVKHNKVYFKIEQI